MSIIWKIRCDIKWSIYCIYTHVVQSHRNMHNGLKSIFKNPWTHYSQYNSWQESWTYFFWFAKFLRKKTVRTSPPPAVCFVASHGWFLQKVVFSSRVSVLLEISEISAIQTIWDWWKDMASDSIFTKAAENFSAKYCCNFENQSYRMIQWFNNKNICNSKNMT